VAILDPLWQCLTESDTDDDDADEDYASMKGRGA
jgi:hypothetical protein